MDEMENESLSFEKMNKNVYVARKRGRNRVQEADLGAEEDEDQNTIFIDSLPNDEFGIRTMLAEVNRFIALSERQFFIEEDSDKEEDLKQITNVGTHEQALREFKDICHMKQFWCMPLSVDVRDFDFQRLIHAQKQLTGGKLFDVITVDPPWQLSTANPTRGVAISYDSLSDQVIYDIPFERLQEAGFLFLWVINAKFRFALELMEKKGYKLVDEVAWVKQTCNGKVAKGHGFYLQHAKETCLVGLKGAPTGVRFNRESDVVFSERRGQSQKPDEIYEIVEALMPNGQYLEIFGRRNNLHNGWFTLGNEL